ncbi:MAG: hypothetical protein M0P49_05780 [Bacilli bacterium]|nr:hypothetical protein [Bacilli bacterium]
MSQLKNLDNVNFMNEAFGYYKTVNGNKVLDEEKIKKDVNKIAQGKDNKAFKSIYNIFISLISFILKITTIASAITIIGIPIAIVLFVLTQLIELSKYGENRDEELERLYDDLRSRKINLENKTKKEKDKDKRKLMNEQIQLLDRCITQLKNVSRTVKQNNNSSESKEKKKSNSADVEYYFPHIEDVENLETETKKWIKNYPKIEVDLEYPIEFLYFCGYSERDILNFINKEVDMTNDYIGWLNDSGNVEASDVANFFKDKKLYELFTDGSGNDILYCNNGKLYFFEHEDDCQINLNNTSTILKLLAVSKSKCQKNSELMKLYKDKNIKESYLYILNSIQIK